MFLIINRLFKKCKYIKEIIHIFDQQMHLLITYYLSHAGNYVFRLNEF